MNWKLPNQLTVGRIVLAAAFFVLLGLYSQDSATGPWLLNAAFVVYIVAGVTDVLDGYLARRWNVATAFGRIADPFVDKVLVVGAFAMLAGPNFLRPFHIHLVGCPTICIMDLPRWLAGDTVSAVQPWMVVVVLGREFIVSAVRGYSESCGMKFPATYAGKIKMLIQSVAICTALFIEANMKDVPWACVVTVVVVWLAVVVTVVSAFAYLGKARKLLLSDE
ncbi:MAG: CDP-alcohol phosphatidyltransferase family protein [Planctomycetota bacterium]|jgi:phosphatidylglycerophosphate synthase